MFLAAALPLAAQALPESAFPPDTEIRKILAERVDSQRQGVGIVVGVIDPHGRKVVAYGSPAKGDTHALNGDTVFQLGSVTKAFTSLLLADMVERKQVALADPVAKYLPPEVKVPKFEGHEITLESLSTQTSGLPRMPSNLSRKDPANPYADYSAERLYEFLAGYKLPQDIGERYEYSNVGVGLLAHALARGAGMDFEALVRSRITEPLAMSSTGVALSPQLEQRLASGYDASLAPVRGWDLGVLVGAGGIHSTANDLLNFLAAILDYNKTPLAPAIKATLQGRHHTNTVGQFASLGWLVSHSGSRQFQSLSGGNNGFRSFIAFDVKAGLGVVVLSNTSTREGVDDIGRHLLDRSAPLAKIQPHTEVPIDPKLLDLYVGRYQFTPESVLSITREGDRLSAQLTGQAKYPIFPESDRRFFYRVVDAQITFETDGQKPAAAVVLHQKGLDRRAARTERDAPAPKQHTAIALDPKIFDRYVGKYTVSENFGLTVTCKGDHLFAEVPGQKPVEIFPESERVFFVKDFDAQITFESTGDAPATGLILHQNGKDQRAQRIP